MGIFLLIILGLFIWAIIRPVWIARKRWQEMQRQAEEYYNRQNQRRPQSEPQRKQKKIDPTVGEYVEFTETHIHSEETKETADGKTTIETESQITDITWEDIPEK